MPLFVSGTVGDRFAVWELADPVTGIGRSSKNAIQLVDATVSKEHAEILREGDRWQVRDLDSRNGTRVNGEDVHGTAPLAVGDLLEIGHVPLRVSADHPSPPTRLSDSVALRSSIKLKADQFLGQEAANERSAGQLVHLLAEAGRLLILPRPLKETCDEILQIVEKAVPAARLILLLRPADGGEPQQIAARYMGGNAREPLVLSRAIMRTVLEENTSVITTDATEDPRFREQMSIVAQSVHSAMAVPLFDNQRVLGLLYADLNSPITTYTQEHLEVLTLLANMAAVKITNARLLETEREQARVQQELATAIRIQRSLLPGDAPPVPGYRFQAFLETCHEVGGDLYDFAVTGDGGVYFILGDVSGKGMGAALLMSSVIASARVLYEACPDPGDLTRRLSAMLHRSTESKHFVTAFVGRLVPATGVISYVNAGHPAPYVVTESGSLGLEANGVPLGVLADFPYETASVTLSPGALLAVFSDGIPEAQRGEEFFDEQRLEESLRAVRCLDDLEAMSRKVIADVDAFLAGAPRTDDITLMLLRREG